MLLAPDSVAFTITKDIAAGLPRRHSVASLLQQAIYLRLSGVLQLPGTLLHRRIQRLSILIQTPGTAVVVRLWEAPSSYLPILPNAKTFPENLYDSQHPVLLFCVKRREHQAYGRRPP